MINLQMRQLLRSATTTLCFVLLTFSASGADFSETKPAEQRVTLNVKNQPLREVLALLSRTTGYSFILDENWQGYPVTTYLHEAPLHAGLKRILTSLNHVIVYLPDSRIKIVIFDKPLPGSSSSGRQAAKSSIEPPASSPPRLPARPPAPAPPGLSSSSSSEVIPESIDPDVDEPETNLGKNPGDDESPE
jgi:type II secretory pathway component GspD/PulD (secretin)